MIFIRQEEREKLMKYVFDDVGVIPLVTDRGGISQHEYI